MTLYETISALKSLSLSQPNVRTVTDGNIYDSLNANPSIEYDVMHILQTSHRTLEERDMNWEEYGFTLFYVSRLKDNNGNTIYIQSIAKEVLENVIMKFCNSFDAEVVKGEIKYQPFEQKFVDECAGMYAEFKVRIPSDAVCPDEYMADVAPAKTITSNGIYFVGPYKIEVDVK